MTTPEGKVKEWLRPRVKKRYPNAWHYAPPGGRFGQAGTMDDVWLIDGVFLAIESKSGESGSGLTDLQKHRLSQVHRAGGIAASMIGKDAAKLEQIFAEVDRRRRLWASSLATTSGQLTRDESPSSTSATQSSSS